jgi:hypothetical protein
MANQTKKTKDKNVKAVKPKANKVATVAAKAGVGSKRGPCPDGQKRNRTTGDCE